MPFLFGEVVHTLQVTKQFTIFGGYFSTLQKGNRQKRVFREEQRVVKKCDKN